MATDISRLVDKLRSFEEKKTKKDQRQSILWKPKAGQQKIRIVPSAKDPTFPFIELKFYYGLNGKTFLAPSCLGKPDPIWKFISESKQSKTPEIWQFAYKLLKDIGPKPRTYLPIIVRGEEQLGVRFWGFGQTVYKQIAKVMSKVEDYGDIVSLTDGNDIEIDFIENSGKKTEDGKNFPETTVFVSPKKSPEVPDSLIEKIKNQPDILTAFTIPTEEQLQSEFDKYMNPENEEHSEPETSEPSVPSNQDVPAETEPVASSPTPVVGVEAASAPNPFDDWLKKI